jgi:hypothetical protein
MNILPLQAPKGPVLWTDAKPVNRFLNTFDQRARVLPLLLGLVVFLGGCETDTATPAAASPNAAALGQGQKATPSANVSRLQAWKDAELIASLGEGRLEVVGSGDSMRPVYGDNTILVISRIAFESLQPGMTIAYTNGRGHRVVHQLLEADRLGWRIQGLNNEVEDRERVTRENIIGVVYASLAYDPALK